MQKSKRLIKSLYFVLAVLSSFGAGWFFFKLTTILGGYGKWADAAPSGILLFCFLFLAALLFYAGYHIQGKETWGLFILFLVFILPALISVIPAVLKYLITGI